MNGPNPKTSNGSNHGQGSPAEGKSQIKVEYRSFTRAASPFVWRVLRRVACSRTASPTEHEGAAAGVLRRLLLSHASGNDLQEPLNGGMREGWVRAAQGMGPAAVARTGWDGRRLARERIGVRRGNGGGRQETKSNRFLCVIELRCF
ncbi:hypothetical protein SEVIR_9G301350v4 [Setaria viridis]